MSKKSSNDLKSLLTPEVFASNPTTEVAIDADERKTIRLHLDQIEFSLLNPRKNKNPKYDEIKASVLALRKLKSILVVTQHPGEECYRLKAGGNTRLRILKEVYEETNDENMAHQIVMFEPYGSDVSSNKLDAGIVFDHLAENILRGDNTLLEKAQAVQEAMDLLTSEEGIDADSMSERKWTAIIQNEYGLPITRAAFRAYQYTLHVLIENIPIALSNGLGRPTVHKISRIQKLYREYAETRLISATQFDLLFCTVLSKSDGETINIKEIEDAISDELSQFLGGAQTPSEIANIGSNQDTGLDVEREIPQQMERSDKPIDEPLDPITTEIGVEHTEQAYSPQITPNLEKKHSLAVLRRESFLAANDVAKEFDLVGLVTQINLPEDIDDLYGFYIEFPDQRLVGDEYQKACWWFLFHLSDLMMSQSVFRALKQDSLLGILLEQYKDSGLPAMFERFGGTVGKSNAAGEWIPPMLSHPTCSITSVAKLLSCIQKIKLTRGGV